jgi:hypothetical protein
MTVAEMSMDEPSGSPMSAASAARSRGWRHRWAWILAAACVGLTVVGVLTGKAAVYQPIGWGGINETFPGMPAGVGIKVVNNFALVRFGDYYVPPQRGVFTLSGSIVNHGSRPVTIETVTTSLIPGANSFAVAPAGQVRYVPVLNDPGTPRSHVLRNVTLGPGQEILIGIPLRTRPCGNNDGWVTDPAFYVKERFLVFTHTVAFPWTYDGGELIMHNPGGEPGEPGAICAPR